MTGRIVDVDCQRVLSCWNKLWVTEYSWIYSCQLSTRFRNGISLSFRSCEGCSRPQPRHDRQPARAATNDSRQHRRIDCNLWRLRCEKCRPYVSKLSTSPPPIIHRWSPSCDSITVVFFLRSPQRDEAKMQHEEIIAELNQRLSQKAGQQIDLNETRDHVRNCNKRVRKGISQCYDTFEPLGQKSIISLDKNCAIGWSLRAMDDSRIDENCAKRLGKSNERKSVQESSVMFSEYSSFSFSDHWPWRRDGSAKRRSCARESSCSSGEEIIEQRYGEDETRTFNEPVFIENEKHTLTSISFFYFLYLTSTEHAEIIKIILRSYLKTTTQR